MSLFQDNVKFYKVFKTNAAPLRRELHGGRHNGLPTLFRGKNEKYRPSGETSTGKIGARKTCDRSNLNNFSWNGLFGNRRFRPRQLVRVLSVMVQGYTQGEVEYQKKNGGKGSVGSAYGF
jgi:hypothetical protein